MKQSLKYNVSPAVIVVVALLLAIAPFLVVAIPPMTDYCQHILVAKIVADYRVTQFRFANFFTLDFGFKPLLLPHLCLAFLVRVCESLTLSPQAPFLAGKIFLAVFVCATWFVMFLLLRSQKLVSPALQAILVLPLCLSGFVYMGFLPFIMTFPLFLLALFSWFSIQDCRLRTLIVGALAYVTFAFHLVGGIAIGVALGVIMSCKFRRKDQIQYQELFCDLCCLLPLLIATALFLRGDSGVGDLKVVYQNPFAMLRAFFGYNFGGVSPQLKYILSIGFGLFCCKLLKNWKDLAVWTEWQVVSLVLLLIGLASPISVGILWPAGPRLFPFLFLCLIPQIKIDECGRWFLPIFMAILCLQSAVIIQRSLEIQSDYQTFLSASDQLPQGAKLLPVVNTADWQVGGIQPFWSIASGYTVLRGGAHPYVFAKPYWKTGGAILSYRNYSEFPMGYQYVGAGEGSALRNYIDASQFYDAAIVWKMSQDENLLSREFPHSSKNQSLVVFQK